MRPLLAPNYHTQLKEKEEKEKESCSPSFQITGVHALLFDDDTLAAFVNSPDALLPWNGDQSLLIDRYDVRHFLQDLSGVRKRRPAPPLEANVLEEDLAYERFRDLDDKLIEDSKERVSQEDTHHLPPHPIEEPSMSVSGNITGNFYYQAVPFSYSTEAPMSSKAEETTRKAKGFVPPFPVPEFLQSKLPGSEKLHQIMAGTAKFVTEHGGQSEFLLKVKHGDNPMFGFLNSDHNLHEYYRYLVQHPELLRPGSSSNAESRNIGGEGLSLLGSAYGTGDDDDDDTVSDNNNTEEEGLGKLKNAKELVSAASSHLGEGKSKGYGANGLVATNSIADSSRSLKGTELKLPKAVSKESIELEKKKKILGGPKDYILPNKTILPKVKDTKSKSKSEKENKDNVVDRPSSRFEPRGSWQAVPNKEYGMSADAAAAVVLAATRGTRGIIKQDSNISSSSGLSQRVFSNGERQGGCMNNHETTTANAMAQAAAIAASREADSADALLTPAEKLKAERLRRAKMFAAMIKSGKCSTEIDFEFPGSLGAGSGTLGSGNAANSNGLDVKDAETKDKYRDASHLENRRSLCEEVEENRVKESEHDLGSSKSKKSHRRRKHSKSDSEHDHHSGKRRLHRHHGSEKRRKHKRHDSDSSDADDCRDGAKVSGDEDRASQKQRRRYHSKREHRSKKVKSCEDDQLDSDRERKKCQKIRTRDRQSDSEDEASKKKLVASQPKELHKEEGVPPYKRSESPSCLKVTSLSSGIQKPDMTVDVPADIRAKVREMLLSTL